MVIESKAQEGKTMTNLKKARQMRGMAQKELARLMEISPQSLNQYEAGASGLGPKLLALAADALEVCPAYLRGISPVLPVRNPGTGDIYMCAVVADTPIEGYGVLYIVEHPDEFVGMIPAIIADGVQFTAWDWQSSDMPWGTQDIQGIRWQDAHGRPVVMLDGLPRLTLGGEI